MLLVIIIIIIINCTIWPKERTAQCQIRSFLGQWCTIWAYQKHHYTVTTLRCYYDNCIGPHNFSLPHPLSYMYHLQGLKLKQIPGDSNITLRPHEEQHESPFMKETLTIHVYIHHTCFLEAASWAWSIYMYTCIYNYGNTICIHVHIYNILTHGHASTCTCTCTCTCIICTLPVLWQIWVLFVNHIKYLPGTKG